MVIALLTVSFQALRAARANPVDSLSTNKECEHDKKSD